MSDATAQIRIDIVATGAEAGANRVNAALDRVGNKGRTLGAANDNLKGTFDRLGTGMGGAADHGGRLGTIFDTIKNKACSASPAVGELVGVLGRMGLVAAGIGAVALAIGAVSVKALDAASKQQQWMAQLEVMTGSAQKAKESYAALVQFAAKTPFDLGQSIEGFNTLRSLGIQASERALTSFGNVAAAKGKDLKQVIEAVADASTGEFERVKEAFGVTFKTVGNDVKFTFQGVTTTVAKNSKDITEYLTKIGETKFGSAMVKQMDSIKGAAANLDDNIFQAFAAFGNGALAKSWQEFQASVANGVAAITPLFASVGNVIGSIVGAVGNVLNSLGSLWLSLHGGASTGTTMLDALTVTFNLVAQGVEVFGNIVAATFGAMGGLVDGVLMLFSDGFSTLFSWMGISFETGGRSWGNSIVGILRAVKSVVTAMPKLFAIAINDTMRMFRDLGSGIMAFLAGDFAKGMALFSKPQFGNTSKAIGAIGTEAVAVANDVKGADAAIDRLLGRNKIKPKLDAGNALTPKPDPNKPDKDKAASEAEKRAKAEADFWKTLQGEVETAKLLPLAAEDHRKELELQKILGRDLIDGEKVRIADLMQQTRIAKILTGMTVDSQKASRDIANQEALLTLRKSGATEQQLAVEKLILDKRAEAITAGATLATFQTDAWKAAEGQLRTDQTRLGVLNQQSKALDDQAAKLKTMAQTGSTFAKDALRTNGSIGDRRGLAAATQAETLKNLKAALDSTDKDVKITPAEFQAGVDKAGEDFRATMAEIGTAFSQRMGRIAGLLDTIGGIIGGKLGSFVQGAGDLSKNIGNFSTTQTDIQDQFGKVFGSNSAAVKGIGKAVGGAVAGMQIGEQIAGLGKALGVKTSKVGGQIGGAIGGAAFGPLGAAVGGTLGSIVGGFFKKTPKGAAVITGGSSSTISGNKGSVRDSLKGSVSSLQGGLQSVADQLGGQLGDFRVSIGKYKDSYRVSSSGASNVDTKKAGKISGLVYNGKDEAAAISAALGDAIRDGAITGLSDLMQKALQANAGNVDKAVNAALRIKDFETSYKELFDPIGAAVDAIKNPMKTLRETMNSVGASSADLARVQAMESKRLADALKEQVSGFQSLLDDLNGNGGGVTALNQLTADLSKLDTFKSDLASGKAVDQEAFTALAQKIMGNAGEVYGTNTSDFQTIISGLKDATGGAITNATNAFNGTGGNAAVATAVADSANAITATQSIGNDYLRQIAEAVQNGGLLADYASGNGNVLVKNGRLVQAF